MPTLMILTKNLVNAGRIKLIYVILFIFINKKLCSQNSNFIYLNNNGDTISLCKNGNSILATYHPSFIDSNWLSLGLTRDDFIDHDTFVVFKTDSAIKFFNKNGVTRFPLLKEDSVIQNNHIKGLSFFNTIFYSKVNLQSECRLYLVHHVFDCWVYTQLYEFGLSKTKCFIYIDKSTLLPVSVKYIKYIAAENCIDSIEKYIEITLISVN